MEKFNRFYSSMILIIVVGVLLKVLFNPTEGCGSLNLWSVFFFITIYIFLFILMMINNLLKSELLSDGLHSEYSLTLRATKTFKVILKNEERNCRFTGSYTLRKGTLNLISPQLQTQSDSLFRYKYLLDYVAKTLYPIKELDSTIESSKKQNTVLSNKLDYSLIDILKFNLNNHKFSEIFTETCT